MKHTIKRLLISGLTFTAALNGIGTGIFIKAFGRKKQSPGRHSAWLSEHPCEEAEQKSCDGLRLFARIFMPRDAQSTKEAPTIILCVHGYHSDGIGDFAPFVPFYTSNGYIVCLVDDRAHGQSEGRFIGFGFQDRYDCLTWIDYLVKRYGSSCRIFLHGISMGGAAVLSCCDSRRLPPQVCGIISDCAFTSGREQIAHIIQARMHLPAFPMLQIFNRVCRLMGGYDLNAIAPIRHVRRSRVPILFIHGDKDRFVPTTMVYRLYHACRCQKQLLIVRGAGHALSREKEPAVYEKAVQNFLARCLAGRKPT